MQAAEIVATHTFGSVLRGCDFDGMSVEEVLMPPRLTVLPHAHEAAQIYFLLEGRYVESDRIGAHLLEPGDTWCRPPREPHANSVPGDEGALTLIVTIEQRRFSTAQRLSEHSERLRSSVLNELRSEMLREISRGDSASATALEGWSLLLLSRTERLLNGHNAGTPEWLGDAVQWIDQSYQQPISLNSVAAQVGVHPATLAAAFRRFRQTSVGDYIRNRRLDHACAELLSTRRAIKEIALDAGFYDQAHFGRWFKSRFGLPPAAARLSRGTGLLRYQE